MFITCSTINERLMVQEATNDDVIKYEVEEVATDVYDGLLFVVKEGNSSFIDTEQFNPSLYATVSFTNATNRIKELCKQGKDSTISIFNTSDYTHILTINSNGYEEFRVITLWDRLPVYLLSDILNAMHGK